VSDAAPQLHSASQPTDGWAAVTYGLLRSSGQRRNPPHAHRYSRNVTSYPSPLDPAAAAELDAVRKAILPVVGPSLVGLYLFGSLARGEFDTGISDIDLIVVLVDSPDEELAERLVRMHDNLIRANPDWDDRIDVIYISRDGLANCRTDTTTIGVISPGEPFHIVPAGRDWVLDWYPAR
jgi:predicted nucleotidyltransferase